MSIAKLGGGVAVLAGLTACGTMPSDDNTVRNAPQHSGIKDYGSSACAAANIQVTRTNELSMAFNPVVINGYTYPAYTVPRSPAYTPYAGYYNYLGANPNQVAATTATSNTREIFTLIPGPPPKQLNAGLLGTAGLVGGSLIGGGTFKIASAVLAGVAGVYVGEQQDQKLQEAYLKAVTRCTYDIEAGAYNRPGGPIPSDLAYAHPLSTWNGRINNLLPGYRR